VDIESSAKFSLFISNCYYRAYEIGILIELADNELFSCSTVVGDDWL